MRDSAYELPHALGAARLLQFLFEPANLGACLLRGAGVLDEDREVTLTGGWLDRRRILSAGSIV